MFKHHIKNRDVLPDSRQTERRMFTRKTSVLKEMVETWKVKTWILPAVVNSEIFG